MISRHHCIQLYRLNKSLDTARRKEERLLQTIHGEGGLGGDGVGSVRAYVHVCTSHLEHVMEHLLLCFLVPLGNPLSMVKCALESVLKPVRALE
jgi:hypothetical protein